MEHLAHRDPEARVAMVRRAMVELIGEIRDEVQVAEEPRAKALMETSAEVLTGLIRACEHYVENKEPAWHR